MATFSPSRPYLEWWRRPWRLEAIFQPQRSNQPTMPPVLCMGCKPSIYRGLIMGRERWSLLWACAYLDIFVPRHVALLVVPTSVPVCYTVTFDGDVPCAPSCLPPRRRAEMRTLSAKPYRQKCRPSFALSVIIFTQRREECRARLRGVYPIGAGLKYRYEKCLEHPKRAQN